jgi:hypothetical protein
MECSICKDNELKTWGRRSSITELLEARRSGCWFCSTVLDAVDVFKPGWTSEHYTDGWISSNSHHVERWFDLGVLDDWTETFRLYQHARMFTVRYPLPTMLYSSGLHSCIC